MCAFQLEQVGTTAIYFIPHLVTYAKKPCFQLNTSMPLYCISRELEVIGP